MGRRMFVPANPDLADMLGRADFDFEMFYFFDVCAFKISRFIASVDPDIPYSLLGFYPHFFMSDLPGTSRTLAERCRTIAYEEGLKRVKIGNAHLLT